MKDDDDSDKETYETIIPEAPAKTVEERRRRRALDGLLATNTGLSKLALEKMPEADRQAYMFSSP